MKTKNHPVVCWSVFNNQFPIEKKVFICNEIIHTMVNSSTNLIVSWGPMYKKPTLRSQCELCPGYYWNHLPPPIFISPIQSFTKLHKFSLYGLCLELLYTFYSYHHGSHISLMVSSLDDTLLLDPVLLGSYQPSMCHDVYVLQEQMWSHHSKFQNFNYFH